MLTVCRVLVIASSIIGSMLASTVLHAHEAKAAAEALFQEGREALAKGDTTTACEKFQHSDELEPAPGTRLNLGECELQRGRVATAYFLFLAVERQLSESDVRAPIARTKREAAEKRLPKLLIKLPQNAPPDARVTIRGRLYLSPELAEPLILDPGLVEVTVGAPQLNPSTLRVQVEQAKVTNVVVPPQVFGAAPSAPQAPPTLARNVPQTSTAVRQHQAERTVRASSKKTGVIFLGVGVAGGVLGGVAGILTLDAKGKNNAHCNSAAQTCDSEGRDAASRGLLFGTLTTAGLAIGAVGTSLGTYLLARDEPRKPAAKLQLTSFGSGAEVSLVQPF